MKVVYDSLLCYLIHSSIRAQRRDSSASFLKATSVLKHTDEQIKINNNFAFVNYERFGHEIMNANLKMLLVMDENICTSLSLYLELI